MIRAREHIAAMAPYTLADLSVPSGVQAVSLAQNESARTPSPKALAAIGAAGADGALYPDPDWSDLRAAIAEVHGVDPAAILCGAGSMELISALIKAYAGPKDAVLSTQYAYAFFRTATEHACAHYHAAAETDFTVSVEALLEMVTPETKIVTVANPGNPTGTVVSRAELIRLRDSLRSDTLLVVDEAYGEFAAGSEALCRELLRSRNTVILRTFSKAYALAGFRVGWGHFPTPIANEIRKVLNPNNVSAISQAAAAAAMRDQAYMRASVAEIASRRDGFVRQLARIGIKTVPSSTNFLLMHFSSSAEASSADEALRSGGILARTMGAYGLSDCLRVTIGTGPQMGQAAEVLATWRAKEQFG